MDQKVVAAGSSVRPQNPIRSGAEYIESLRGRKLKVYLMGEAVEEPVDHPINAMNLAGGASENGMTLLGRGERLTRTFRFTVERTGLRSMPGGRGARRKQ